MMEETIHKEDARIRQSLIAIPDILQAENLLFPSQLLAGQDMQNRSGLETQTIQSAHRVRSGIQLLQSGILGYRNNPWGSPPFEGVIHVRGLLSESADDSPARIRI